MNNRQQRLYFFLVVWFTMISFLSGWGQNIRVIGLKKDFLKLSNPGVSAASLYPGLPLHTSQTRYFSAPEDLEQMDIYAQGRQIPQLIFNRATDESYVQPPNLYYIQSGFFCKREWEFEKATHIPFRFRLGSLAECNTMEGKN
ncbi:MAG TPA: hypothetical protein VFE04_00245 [Puia sp.]|jgi:hypothetical protein|nr:hypothetical protein [Puia sp.]